MEAETDGSWLGGGRGGGLILFFFQMLVVGRKGAMLASFSRANEMRVAPVLPFFFFFAPRGTRASFVLKAVMLVGRGGPGDGYGCLAEWLLVM